MEENKDSKKYRKIGPYILIKQIGKGSFSTVYEAREGLTGPVYAIKQISLQNLNPKQRERITQQVNTLSIIKHQNIIHLIDFKQTVRNLYLVFQHCKYTDLNNYIHNNFNGVLPEEQVRKIMNKLKGAFMIIREHKIVHRDLKLQNILVTQDFQIKLADFGFAKFLDENEYFKSIVGTVLTMAPEVFLKKKYNQKCDIWSLGIIAYEMIFGCNPFFKKNKMVSKQIGQAFLKKLQFPFKISDLAQDMISKMLVVDPQKRLDFVDFFQHKWLCDTPIFDLKQILKGQALKCELHRSLSNSTRSNIQKDFIMNHCHDIIAYCFIESVKNYIENSLTSWINIAKHILDLQFQNKTLRFVALSLLLHNIDITLSSELKIIVNGSKTIAVPKYMELRNFQTWPMSEYTKRLPNFLLKSKSNIEEFLQLNSKEVVATKSSDTQLTELLLEQLQKQAQSTADRSYLKIFLKIKLWTSSDICINVESAVITKGALDILVRHLNLQLQYDDLCKKCGNMFKLKIINEQLEDNNQLKHLKQLILNE